MIHFYQKSAVFDKKKCYLCLMKSEDYDIGVPFQVFCKLDDSDSNRE